VSRASKAGLPGQPAPRERPDPAATDGLALRPSADGTLLPVRVTPRASRAGVDGVADGALRVRLTAPPVEGAANAALIGFLAERLGLPKSAVTLVAGATSRRKTLHIAGLTPDEVRARLRLGGA
jgi:uncharacterized protein